VVVAREVVEAVVMLDPREAEAVALFDPQEAEAVVAREDVEAEVVVMRDLQEAEVVVMLDPQEEEAEAPRASAAATPTAPTLLPIAVSGATADKRVPTPQEGEEAEMDVGCASVVGEAVEADTVVAVEAATLAVGGGRKGRPSPAS